MPDELQAFLLKLPMQFLSIERGPTGGHLGLTPELSGRHRLKPPADRRLCCAQMTPQPHVRQHHPLAA